MSSGATSIGEKPQDSSNDNNSDSKLESNLPTDTGNESAEAEEVSPREIHGVVVRTVRRGVAHLELLLTWLDACSGPWS
jgi:hypothetical protein